MTQDRVHMTAWVLGILATLAGAFGGALFNHFFGRQATIEAERRSEVRKAVDEYLSKRYTDPKGSIGPKYRLTIYADSNVLKTFAEASRIEANADTSESQRRVLCASQTPNARNVVEGRMRFIAAVRRQTLEGDPSDNRDLAAIICPFPEQRCFGEKYVAHLFDCGAASAK
jgi:hypothetical protein